jgi:hypothetical protein
MSDFALFLLGFGFNLIMTLVLVRFIYYPTTQNKRYVFTFLAFSTMIYFVLSFLVTLDISIGAGFGLFAIFTILRYRTDPIPVREMTYLFVIVALPVMNSTGTSTGLWPQLIAANIAILTIMFVLEKEWGFHFEASRRITYEKIDLIRPDRRPELVADLEQRLGLKIKRVVVGKVNFLRDTAEVTVYYEDVEQESWFNAGEPVAMLYSGDDVDS